MKRLTSILVRIQTDSAKRALKSKKSTGVTPAVFSFLMVVAVLAGCRREPQLLQSIRDGDPTTADRIIADGADVNAAGSHGETPLLTAIKAGDKASYSELLRRGADPNARNAAGTSAMHRAAEHEDSFWLREALAHGGDPNVVNVGNRVFVGDTPIYYAISKSRGENVRLLIDSGANVNYQNGSGNTALWNAMEHFMYAEAKLLIEKGADPRLCGKDGVSILNYQWFRNAPPQRGRATDAEYAKRLAEYNQLQDLLTEKGYLPPRGAPK